MAEDHEERASGYTWTRAAYIILPLNDDVQCLHSNTSPVNKQAPLTTWSGSVRFLLAAEHHTAENNSKTDRIKPIKLLPWSNLSWTARHDFLKIPNLIIVTNFKTEQRCFSKVMKNYLTTDQPYKPTRTPVMKNYSKTTRGGNDELEPNTAAWRVDHHLWGGLAFIRTP